MDYIETSVVPLAELTRFPGNSRRHATARIRESVRKGQYKSLLAWRKPDGLVIVAGNGTADAMEAEGVTEARVEIWDYTEAEALWANISDNRLSDLAEDDDQLVIEQLRQLDGNYEGTGWTPQEAAVMLGEEVMPPAGDADIDDSVGNRWGLVVECGTEEEQIKLLGELAGQGYNVRAIM